MVVVSYSGKEINAKLVYYGPGLSGKTTNLEYIYQSVPSTSRGKMVSMKTRTERTLFFDFLPIDLGDIGGFKTRFLLYTVPGQVYYNATRKLVLRGVDAVIFVADSGRGKMEENIESLQNLRENLREYGLSLDEMPWVIQYNKRDLPDAYTLEELEAALNPGGAPYFEAVATGGQGVFECFRGIARLLLNKLSQEIKLGAGTRGAPAPAVNPAAAAASTSEETASGTPPPGLMSGGPTTKAYRPPVPPSPGEAANMASKAHSTPTPPRPAAPGVADTRSMEAPPRTREATPPSRPAYRPPVPGSIPTPPPARPAAPRLPQLPELQPQAQDFPSAPGGVAGADWFQENTPDEAAPLATQVPSGAAPSPRRTLPKVDQEAWTAEDAETTQIGFDRRHQNEVAPAQDSWDAPEKFSTPPAPPAMPPSGMQRAEALARRLEEETETHSLESLEPAEENPGFWGRIFRRRKDRLEYRRYPSRLDMPASSSEAASPAFEAEPESFRREPESFPPAPPAFGAVPDSFETGPETFHTDPEPRAPVSEARNRPSVILKLAKGADPVVTSEMGDPSAYAEDPVLLERTLQVPITLGPEAVRRGARLRLTLEVVVEVSETTGGASSLEETQAA